MMTSNLWILYGDRSRLCGHDSRAEPCVAGHVFHEIDQIVLPLQIFSSPLSNFARTARSEEVRRKREGSPEFQSYHCGA